MSEAIAASTDLSAISIPRSVWSKSSRPFRGLLFRFTLGMTFVLVGLAIPGVAAKIGLTIVGVGVFLWLPSLVDGRLEALRDGLRKTPPAEAGKHLKGLDERRLVLMFAPCAWTSLTKGELHLKQADGRAAARAFAEAARQVGDIKMPALAGAQAHALTLAGDRKEARALLTDLEQRDALTARDRLNLAITYVEDPAKTSDALRHVEVAADALGDHPRAGAALALALARNGKDDDAVSKLEAIEALDGVSEDPLAAELVRRARKVLRQRQATETKKAKKTKPAKSAPDVAEAKGKEAASPQKGKSLRKQKRERKKDRREKRKARGKKNKPDAAPPEPKTQRVEAREAAKSPAVTAKDAQAEAQEAKRAADTATERADREKAEATAAQRKKAADEAAEAARAKAEAKAAAQKRAADDAAQAAREKAAAQKKAADEAAQVAREKAAAQKKAADEAAKLPKPPAISFEGPDAKPVFAAPATRPAAKPGAPKIPIPAIPKIEIAAPPKVGAPPKVAPPAVVAAPKPGATPAKVDEGWDDLFGDD